MYDIQTKQGEIDSLRDLVAAARSGNNSTVDKIASKFSEILAIGGYMYGAARQIYGALADGQFHTLTGADTDKIKIENDNERIRIELPVQPDIEEFIGETRPRKLLGEPYLETASGRYVSGYLTTLKTPIIGKPLDLIEVYPYDFVKEMKDSRHLSIFKKEDRFWFYGNYQLIAEMEEFIPGSSLMTSKFDKEWENAPHKKIIDLMKLHASPVKLNQPRELLVMPEELYLDFGKIDHAVINNMAGDFLKSGFTPNDSPLYQIRKLMLRDSRGLTFDSQYESRTLFTVPDKLVGSNPVLKVFKLLKTFGYNVAVPSSEAAAESNEKKAYLGLQTTGYADYLDYAAAWILDELGKKYGFTTFGYVDWTGVTESSTTYLDILINARFQRILVYSPINYLGRVYLWNRDVRNHIEVKNDYVTTFSDEKITFMFHNKFAVTALDVWTINALTND